MCERTEKSYARKRERERERERAAGLLGRGSGADGMGADSCPQEARF